MGPGHGDIKFFLFTDNLLMPSMSGGSASRTTLQTSPLHNYRILGLKKADSDRMMLTLY